MFGQPGVKRDAAAPVRGSCPRDMVDTFQTLIKKFYFDIIITVILFAAVVSLFLLTQRVDYAIAGLAIVAIRVGRLILKRRK